MRNIKEILSDIESFEPNDGIWLGLDTLLDELWETPNPEYGIHTLFRVFERYPNEDGGGVFHLILHGLETLDYEACLYNSLMDKPSYMGILMLKRIENTNSKLLAGKSIEELKAFIRNNPNIEDELILLL